MFTVGKVSLVIACLSKFQLQIDLSEWAHEYKAIALTFEVFLVCLCNMIV
jgi:hypothetical protein